MNDQWAILADNFPPRLAINKPASACDAGETPAATNLEPAAEGFLLKGSQPAGTARTVKTFTIAGTAWEWHFNRLWRLDDAAPIVYYGAPRYTDLILAQDSGSMTFNEDSASPFIAMLPVGEAGLLAMKAAGSYIIERANTNREEFIHTDFIQEAHIADATHAVELNGLVYFVNTSGVFTIDVQGQIEDLTRDLRGGLPTPAALTCDYDRKYVNVGETHTYDVAGKRWFQYADTFGYTSRELVSQAGEPFAVRQVMFDILRTGDDVGEIDFLYRVDDRDWFDASATTVNDRGQQRAAFCDIQGENGRAFQLRINDMPEWLKIKRIMVLVNGPFVQEARAS